MPTVNTYKKQSKIHLRTVDKAQFKQIFTNKWGIREQKVS